MVVAKYHNRFTVVPKMENSGNHFPINISNLIGVQRERSKSLALASYHQSSSNSVFREKIFKFLMVHSKQNLPETPDTRFAGLKKMLWPL